MEGSRFNGYLECVSLAYDLDLIVQFSLCCSFYSLIFYNVFGFYSLIFHNVFGPRDSLQNRSHVNQKKPLSDPILISPAGSTTPPPPPTRVLFLTEVGSDDPVISILRLCSSSISLHLYLEPRSRIPQTSLRPLIQALSLP